MISLGIESTAHTFGIGIIDDLGNVLANEKHQFTTDQGGITPREALDHHIEFASKTVDNALKKAELDMKGIDIISYSQGPGIGQLLRVGAVAARTLSLKHKKPLIGVNHCVAHIEIGKKKTGCTDPITVYASGANTQIIGFENNAYRVYGETLDVGIGNFLDMFGRKLGLGFPGGPIIDRMYFEAGNYIELPYSVKGMDLVFSGLYTKAVSLIGKEDKTDLAYSTMHTAFAMLTEVAERALAHTNKKEILLCGGVACSKALNIMLGKMCKARGAKLYTVEPQLALDNGAMIAWQGLIEFKSGKKTELKDSCVLPKQRADDVRVTWI